MVATTKRDEKLEMTTKTRVHPRFVKALRACGLLTASVIYGGCSARDAATPLGARPADAGFSGTATTGGTTAGARSSGGGTSSAAGGAAAGGTAPEGTAGDGKPAAAGAANETAGAGGGVTDGRGELARPADAFVDMVGVNGHLNYAGSAYLDHFEDAILPRARELGLRHWRDALSGDPVALAHQATLAALGIHFNLIVHDLDIGLTLEAIKRAVDVTSSIEGPNELDHGYRKGVPAYPDASTRTYKGLSFPALVPAFQNDLYAAIKNDPQTQKLEVVMAGFSFPDNTLDVGLVAGCDAGNTHSYPDGGPPTFRLDDWYIPRMQANSGPDKPKYATETGYHNTPMPDGSHWIPPVSERASSKYDLRLFLEYFNRDFRRVYLYEFADLASSDHAADLNFGLLKSDGTPKAQFTALKALLDLVRDPGPAFVAGRLDYELGATPPELKHTLLQKRDGAFYLVLWLNAVSFDHATRQDLDTTATVHLRFGSGAKSVAAYRPADSAAPVMRVAATTEIDVDVPDQPLVLEIKP